MIRAHLIAENHVLTRDWLPKTEYRIARGDVDVIDIKEIYRACIEALNEADLVIVEDTVSNFSTGHQITLAILRQKPTLVLWHGQKHRHFKKMFIHGIESDFLETAQYDKTNYREIIIKFIKKYEQIKQKNRFHLVLNSVERKYLDWAQFHKEKSRTRVIREAIEKIIDEDQDYQNYLAGKTNVG